MPIVTWDHVHLRSPDPEATAAWLENILGGVIIRTPGGSTSSSAAPMCSSARSRRATGSNAPPVTPYQGLDHFGLTVKDIDAVAAEIKAKGVEFTKEPRPSGRAPHLLHPRAAGHLDRAFGARREICVTAF